MNRVYGSAIALSLASLMACVTPAPAQTAKAPPAYVMLEFTVKDPEAFK